MTEPVDTEKKPTLDEEIEKLSHEDLLEITESSVKRLITADPLLSDLPADVTLEEVLAQIAVAQGQSITITVSRYSESPLNVVIPQKGTTVLDLKKAIRRSFTLKQQRQRIKTKISWKYVWKAFQLQNIGNGKIMRNDKKDVSEYVSEIIHYPWLEQISRQEQLMIGCDNLNMKPKRKVNKSELDHIIVDQKHKLLYCYVPKVACTNWKRVIMVLTGEANVSNLVDIPSFLAHHENSTVKLSQIPTKEAKTYLETYTLFLVTRHPFERLLSAYLNKFVDTLSSSKYFQARYGRHIVKKYRTNATKSDIELGNNVSFPEFVQFILNEGADTNEHWAPIYNLCLPCKLNYSFIGQYETISEDAKAILSMIGAPSIEFPVTRIGHTREKLRYFLQQLSIYQIQALYKMYEKDFKLFGYGLEDVLGFDLA